MTQYPNWWRYIGWYLSLTQRGETIRVVISGLTLYATTLYAAFTVTPNHRVVNSTMKYSVILLFNTATYRTYALSKVRGNELEVISRSWLLDRKDIWDLPRVFCIQSKISNGNFSNVGKSLFLRCSHCVAMKHLCRSTEACGILSLAKICVLYTSWLWWAWFEILYRFLMNIMLAVISRFWWSVYLERIWFSCNYS